MSSTTKTAQERCICGDERSIYYKVYGRKSGYDCESVRMRYEQIEIIIGYLDLNVFMWRLGNGKVHTYSGNKDPKSGFFFF